MKMKYDCLLDVLTVEISRLHDAEKRLLKIMPQLEKRVSNKTLKYFLDDYLTQTEKQVQRLETICGELQVEPACRKSGICSLIKESEEWINTGAEPVILDAGLVVTLLKIKQFEIVSYKVIQNCAELLGLYREKEMLDDSLKEEFMMEIRLKKLSKELTIETLRFPSFIFPEYLAS